MRAPAEPHLKPVTGVRGIQRIWDPRVWGTTIGAVGATVFVMANRGDLPAPWSTNAVLAWTVALAAYLWLVFAVRRDFGAMAPAGARSGLVYVASVVGMLLLIRVGTELLDGAGQPHLLPSLIVVAVGLHFLPFAAAFQTPLFTRLGTLMTVIGVVGLLAGWFGDPRWAAGAAVLTGVVMLGVIAGDAAQGARPGRAR